MATEFRTIKQRRATTAEWAADNPVLAEGEPGVDLTLDKTKVGDGVTPWTGLPFQGEGSIAAADVDFTPTGSIAATDVQGAVAEVASEAASALAGHSHAASAVSFTPTGSIAASDVQAAIAEVASEAATSGHVHAASAVTFTPTGTIAASNVQAAIAEVASEASQVGHSHSAPAASAVPFTPFGSVVATNVQAAIEEVYAEAPGGGGGGAALGTVRARVYQSGGNTIAINIIGGTISSLATSATNNVTVIQAAIDAVAGTYTPGTLTTLGHGGGGTVTLSDQLYEVDDTIDVKYGVSLVGECSLDRNGFVASAHSYQGTVLAPTSGLGTMNVAASGTVTRTPVLLLGRTQNASGTQSTTNPHGVHIRGVGIDMRRKTTAQGIVIADTQFVTVSECMIGEARGAGGAAIEVISTNAPDDGAHGNDIRGNLLVNCEKGIVANGSGSTDSLVSDCRILQMTQRSIEVGASGGGGGWQIAGCHLTTASSDQTGTNECHIYLSGAPCVITGNYFDTTGGYAIYADSPMAVITGNYFKHSSARAAPIYLDGTGRKSVVSGNTVQASSNAAARAFVQFSSTSGQDYRPTIVGNVYGDNGNGSIVGIACDNSGAVIAETNAAMTIARDGSANPFIWGNRMVQSAV